MEVIILLLMIFMYLSTASKLDKLLNRESVDVKKKFPSLNELIGKDIKIETNNELDIFSKNNKQGILKDYDDKWLVLEAINKKQKKELYYYRLVNISSINIINK